MHGEPGLIHTSLYMRLFEDLPEGEQVEMLRTATDGFLTFDGTFLDREEAEDFTGIEGESAALGLND